MVEKSEKIVLIIITITNTVCLSDFTFLEYLKNQEILNNIIKINE